MISRVISYDTNSSEKLITTSNYIINIFTRQKQTKDINKVVSR